MRKKERAREGVRAVVFLPHVSSSASQSHRHPITSPYRENLLVPLHLPRGKRIIYFAHAHAHTRTLAHMRAHRPLPSAGCPSGFGAELAAGPPGWPWARGLCGPSLPDLAVAHSLWGPSPKACLPTPRTVPGWVTTSPSSRDTTRCRRPAPPVSLGSRGNSGPRERTQGQRAERGPRTLGRPRERLRLLERHRSPLSPPLRPPGLGVPAYPSSHVSVGRRTRGGPGGKNEVGAVGEVATSPRVGSGWEPRGQGTEGRTRRGARGAGARSERHLERS